VVGYQHLGVAYSLYLQIYLSSYTTLLRVFVCVYFVMLSHLIAYNSQGSGRQVAVVQPTDEGLRVTITHLDRNNCCPSHDSN